MKINQKQTIAMVMFIMGVSTALNYSSNKIAIAQNSQTESQSTSNVANVNEVKSFVYSWFALLDRQVSEISLAKFLDEDNLTMQFPEMTVKDRDDFSKWYLGVQEAIETNTHDVQQLKIVPQGNGKFDVQLQVDWQAQTREGETITQAYQQQWKIVTDERNRLLIQDYIVEEVE